MIKHTAPIHSSFLLYSTCIAVGLMLCLFIIPTPLRAQENYYEEEQSVFSGGLILGSNFTQVDGDSYYGYHKIGLNAGGVVYVHFNSTFGASLELLYTQKGSRGETVSQSPYIGTYVEKYYMDLNYVEVPILLHIKSGRVDFEGGVSYARLIKSKEWVQTDYPVTINPDINSFKNMDVNYLLGVTYKAYKNLHVNFRYQYSIMTIRDMDRVPAGFSYGQSGQFNNLFTLRLVYYFDRLGYK